MLSALLLLCLTGSVAYAASTISASAHVNANPNPPPPAGKKAVYVKGTYTLGKGDVANKIEASFYTKNAKGDLIFEGSVTDPNYANGQYQTSEYVATQGTAYTVIARLHYKDMNNNNQEAAALFDHALTSVSAVDPGRCLMSAAPASSSFPFRTGTESSPWQTRHVARSR
jgi:hypothetical protein